jgi:hypothetical protein
LEGAEDPTFGTDFPIEEPCAVGLAFFALFVIAVSLAILSFIKGREDF